MKGINYNSDFPLDIIGWPKVSFRFMEKPERNFWLTHTF